jgi:prolyl oligopeptidase
MVDAISKVQQYDFDGVLVREVELPGVGSASGISGKEKDEVLYYSFSNYTTPSTSYQFDPKTGVSKAYIKPDVDFNSEDYESKQVFYNSADGTKVPMIITYKKGLDLNGNNPTILYGYGGFNISLTPSFSIANSVWLEQGGVYAVANLRGGGEYGKEWHIGGIQTDKQNVFDDFIAAAEYLIQEKYTSSDKLAISGRSNGGLLVGACMLQRPNLYQVCLPAVGVQDMLRFHKFTIGWAWTGDYGSSENEDEFKALYDYSPLHNVKETAYPATLVTTADHDDRVVPAHSFKFISELQDKHNGNQPVMIRIDVDAGHGAGKPLSKRIDESSDIWAFVFEHLGVEIAD